MLLFGEAFRQTYGKCMPRYRIFERFFHTIIKDSIFYLYFCITDNVIVPLVIGTDNQNGETDNEDYNKRQNNDDGGSQAVDF